MSTAVLFVCLGNICRSPTAHGVFEHKLREQGLQQGISVDSAGTGAWHIGHPPDERAQRYARARGYNLSALRARQVGVDDFARFDYVLAMDTDNLAALRAMAPVDYAGELGLFLSYAPGLTREEVPDPYYGGAHGFDTVLDLVEQASDGLLAYIQRRL